MFEIMYIPNWVSWLFLLCVRTHHQTKGHVDLLLFSQIVYFLNGTPLLVAMFVLLFISSLSLF